MSLPFTLIAPGQAPITNFQENKWNIHVDLNNPATITSVCITLTAPLPENYALTLSFSVAPYSQMQYLGAISNNRPSDIFSTGFALKPDIAEKTSQIVQLNQRFGNGYRWKKEYSKLVAQNLYNFMSSFNHQNLLVNGAQGQYLVIPSNFLNRWIQKFQEKYAKDPNFILRTTTN